MKRPLAAVAACILLAGGCRMCSDCCDQSPPVADSPYHNPYGRAGSAFTGPGYYGISPLPAVGADATGSETELLQPAAYAAPANGAAQ
ncbi:MAG: hypothetical protein CMJ58_05585 [Planctomycetaceae bacterium]|nr:hypothetical protein [Planctomycetaceae bacterium]